MPRKTTTSTALEDFVKQPQVMKFWPRGAGQPSVPVQFTIEDLVQDDRTYTNTLPDKLKRNLGTGPTDHLFLLFGQLIKSVNAASAERLKFILHFTRAQRELHHARAIRRHINRTIAKFGSVVADDELRTKVLFDRAEQERARKIFEEEGYEFSVDEDQIDYEKLGNKAKKLIDDACAAVEAAFECEQGFPVEETRKYQVLFDSKARNGRTAPDDAAKELKWDFVFRRALEDEEDEEEEDEEEDEEERIEKESIDAGYGPEYYAAKAAEQAAEDEADEDYEEGKDDEEENGEVGEDVDDEDSEGEDAEEEEDDEIDADEVQDLKTRSKIGNPFNRDSTSGQVNKPKKTAFGAAPRVSSPLSQDPIIAGPLKTGNPFQRDTTSGNLGSPKKKVNFSNTNDDTTATSPRKSPKGPLTIPKHWIELIDNQRSGSAYGIIEKLKSDVGLPNNAVGWQTGRHVHPQIVRSWRVWLAEDGGLSVMERLLRAQREAGFRRVTKEEMRKGEGRLLVWDRALMESRLREKEEKEQVPTVKRKRGVEDEGENVGRKKQEVEVESEQPTRRSTRSSLRRESA